MLQLIHLLVLGCLVSTSLHPELLRDGVEPGSSLNTDGMMVYENEDYNKHSEEVVIQYDSSNSNSTMKMQKGTTYMIYSLSLVSPAYQ